MLPCAPVSPAPPHAEPFAVGLDLGWTDLKSARVYADGRLEEFGKRPSRAAESAEAPIEAMSEAFADLTRGRAGCIGVGVGSPGVIDPVTGALAGNTPHFPHWGAFPLRERIAARVGGPVAVSNDANVADL